MISSSQFIPGKLYRLPKTGWCPHFSNAYVTKFYINQQDVDKGYGTNGYGSTGYYLTSNILMFLGHPKHPLFMQGPNIFIFYHSYIETSLQLIYD